MDAIQAYRSGAEMQAFDSETQEVFNALSFENKIEFVRGFFDSNGRVIKSLVSPRCILNSGDALFCKAVKELILVPCVETENGIEYVGINVIEFLHMLYKDVKFSLTFNQNQNCNAYRSLLYCWEPQWAPKGQHGYCGQGMVFKYTKTLDEAIAPQKAHVTDTGYDLCLIKKVKEENGMIMYDTGIAVQPPLGYYFEVVGRSSISKTGYIVANSIGIIDASYTGSLKVALIKVNKDAPELELPARLVQLLPRQLVHLDAVEVQDLSGTQRADGGFGSSGKDSLIA